MGQVSWQPTDLITDAAPGTVPGLVENVAGKIDSRGEQAVLLQATVVGSGYVLCEVYVWNGTSYVNTLCDFRLDASYPLVDLPGGLIYAIFVSGTSGTVTSWGIRYGLESE